MKHRPLAAMKADLRQEIGARLRTLRTSAGLSRAQLARAAKVSLSVVIGAERARSVPRRPAMESIGRALGAPSLVAAAEPWYVERRAINARLGRERGRANGGKRADHGALDAARAALRSDSDPDEAAAEADVSIETVRRWMREDFGGAPTMAPEAARDRRAVQVRASALRRATAKQSHLVAARVQLNLTGLELAERSGVSQSAVSALEIGATSPRSKLSSSTWRGDAVALATFLGLTCEELWPDLAPRAPRLPRPATPARPDDLYDAAQTAAVIRAAVGRLTPQQQLVATVRFGLDGADEATRHGTAAMLGVTPGRVWQIEQQALARLATILGDLRP